VKSIKIEKFEIKIGKKIVKGLEPLIAAVLLITITLVIAIAVVSWTIGLFDTTISRAESLVILPNATLTKPGPNWLLNISIRNTGSYPSNVIAIYVANITCFSGSQTINPGETRNMIGLNCGPTGIINGTRYTIKVVTAAGNTFYGEVIAG
jgi:FlaG/FlaF family flagellin (archaellin)